METPTNYKQINTVQLESLFINKYRTKENVTLFGQTINNPNLNNFEDPTLIDTLEILKGLSNESYDTFDLSNLSMYDETIFPILEYNFGIIEEVAHINTYNWSSPLSNDLDFRVLNSETNTILLVNVHNFGDPRGNYGLQFMFIFDRVEDWFYLFEDLETYKSFEINGICFDFNMFSEAGVFNVYDSNNDLDLEYDIYIGDFEDCQNWIKENKLVTE